MSTNNRRALIVELGVVDYETGLKIQYELHHLRQKGAVEDTLILLEHSPVITLGRRADKRNLLVSEQELTRRGIALYKTERGGDITYHGPGQLVGYLIFRLNQSNIGVRRFVEKIEEALILTVRNFGVKATIKPKQIGIWVEEKKVASIGIAVREGITLHGFAINVKKDLSGFYLINPCGLNASQITALEELKGEKIAMSDVRQAIINSFTNVFGLTFHKNLPRSLTSLTNLASSSLIASASLSE
ncbi:MAG: lipoyl(octanoyl) transferase LipB [candidate division WOR-3 bacterium]